MLTEMDYIKSDVRVGRGAPLPGDGIWLHGNDRTFGMEDDRVLSTMWSKQRNQLAEHAHHCSKASKSSRMSFLH